LQPEFLLPTELLSLLPTESFSLLPVLVQHESSALLVKGVFDSPLVTGSSAGISQADAGVLGQPNTSVLFGGNEAGAAGRDPAAGSARVNGSTRG
jgi:hypothetical protein